MGSPKKRESKSAYLKKNPQPCKKWQIEKQIKGLDKNRKYITEPGLG